MCVRSASLGPFKSAVKEIAVFLILSPRSLDFSIFNLFVTEYTSEISFIHNLDDRFLLLNGKKLKKSVLKSLFFKENMRKMYVRDVYTCLYVDYETLYKGSEGLVFLSQISFLPKPNRLSVILI